MDSEKSLRQWQARERAEAKRRQEEERRRKRAEKRRRLLKPLRVIGFAISATVAAWGASKIRHHGEREASSATALCRDGSYSYSKHRPGTCSGHAGVKKWINLPEY